ncbi:YesL family protein [Enterococcus sp.]|uniref:YesL family protein n=1 Tax=Enterococcus sp. TaxID=35783 RepID=UPI002FC8F51A
MVNKIYEVFNRIYYLMKLNGLWLLFTLLGGVVFGIIPATIALYACIRQQIRNESETHLFQMFKRYYVETFRRSMLFSVVFAAIALFFFGETVILVNVGTGNLLLEIAIKVTRLLIILGVAMFFPIFVHFDVKGIKTVVQPLLFLLICPLEVLYMGIIFVLVSLLFAISPLLILFIGIALPAYGMSLIMMKKFTRLEKNINFTTSAQTK